MAGPLSYDYTVGDWFRGLYGKTHIASGIPLVDQSLSDGEGSTRGLVPTETLEIVGEAGVGKSSLLLHLIAQALISSCPLVTRGASSGLLEQVLRIEPKLGPRVLVFDTDGKFDVVRLLNHIHRSLLAGRHANATGTLPTRDILSDCLSRLVVLQPRDSDHLARMVTAVAALGTDALANLPYAHEVFAAAPELRDIVSICLIAVDSIGAFYWQDRAWRTINVQMGQATAVSQLQRIAAKHQAPVVWTRQLVYFPAEAAVAIAELPRPGAVLSNVLARGPPLQHRPNAPLPAALVHPLQADAPHVPARPYASLLRSHLPAALSKIVKRTVHLSRPVAGPASGEEPSSPGVAPEGRAPLLVQQVHAPSERYTAPLSKAQLAAVLDDSGEHGSALPPPASSSIGGASSSSALPGTAVVTALPVLVRSLAALTAPKPTSDSGSSSSSSAHSQQQWTYLPSTYAREGVDRQCAMPGVGVHEALLWLML